MEKQMDKTQVKRWRRSLLYMLTGSVIGVFASTAWAGPGGMGHGMPGPGADHFAGQGGPGPGGHFPMEREHPLTTLKVLPPHADKFMLSGVEFFFCSGLYYTLSQGHYVVVPAPVGAVVATLPAGYTTLTVGADTYFALEGTYYRKHNNGFIVVPSPVRPVFHAPPPPPQAMAEAENRPGEVAQPLPATVTLMIVNGNGSKTPVSLKHTREGWLGPKGELYTRLPTQEQLAPYYGLSR